MYDFICEIYLVFEKLSEFEDFVGTRGQPPYHVN